MPTTTNAATATSASNQADAPDTAAEPDGPSVAPCSMVGFFVLDDPRRGECVAAQQYHLREFLPDDDDTDALHREAYWDDVACSRPESFAGLTGVTMWTDFYGDREFRNLLMAEYFRVFDIWHELLVCLPFSGTTVRRLWLVRDAGDPPFSERDRLLLSLLRPHLGALRDRVEIGRRTVPALTPRQRELLRRVAAGGTNRQIARHVGLSEGTVRKHSENMYARLDVHSRTEALARAKHFLGG